MEVYEWQDNLYSEWAKRDYIGCVKAPTGSGKTIAGCIALKRFLKDHMGYFPIILTPSTKVSKAWEEELENQGLKDIAVLTYQTAVNRMKRTDLSCDVMIADECHRLCTPVQGQVLNMNPKAILGLSATPEGSTDILGKPFMTVPLSEARICPFHIHLVEFTPTKTEMGSYESMTKRMEERASFVSGGKQTYLQPRRDSVGWDSYDSLARRRREICYLMPSRLPHVLNLVRKNIGRRTVVYFERTESVRELRDMLRSEGIDCAVHIQDYSDLERFENHETDLLLACKSLREGWNDPTISCVILGSINVGTIVNTQTIGRALRIDPDDPNKHSDIYFLMASGTSDRSVEYKLDYPKDRILHEKV